MEISLKEIARISGAELRGDGNVRVGGIASLSSADSHDLVFVENEEKLKQALASRAGAVIAGEFAQKVSSHKPLLIAPNPRLAFARAAVLICPLARPRAGVHSSAVVHPSAQLGSDVSVDALAVIEENVRIGARSAIGAGARLAAGVEIGADCRLGANVVIDSGAKLGQRVIVHAGAVLGSAGFGYVRDPATGRYEAFPQVGRLEIGDDVEIGANCTLDRGALDSTVIGRGVKMDNLVHVGHNVRIGENVVIAAQTGISGSSVIQSNVIVGGQVGIADHVTIAEGAILGAQSGIPSNKVVRGKGIVFWGTPARPIKQYLKELATLARLSRKR